ncbi:MAG: hypothetical protein A2045_17110 [Rhodocyclales bacterium GWA2_65_20]|nr:MAG: hypothetical protein A2045_17110 [Rhodocyclales bacterium GWA2_65_20]
MTVWFSLRRRLLVLLLGGVSVCWLATIVWSYIDVHHEIDEMFEVEHVRAPENDEERHELVNRIAWRLIAPALFGLPLLGAWVWLATRRSLVPLVAVAAQIAGRDPTRLHAIVPESAPEEIRPLVEAINGLFGRVEAALESERQFTADAAHELRTPLAALAAQAQVATRARDETERNHALEQLTAGMARATRLVDQLLTLARIDPEQEAKPPATVQLDRLAEEVCAGHGPQALAKDIALELDAAPVAIPADADLLRILLRNLVDNAIRYTPSDGRVNVTVAACGDGARLAVSDTGPGIPPAERDRVFERFSRLAGQDTEGSGLGLSIVRRIAELHGARVKLEPGGGGAGLVVTVEFLRPLRSAAGACPPGIS